MPTFHTSGSAPTTASPAFSEVNSPRGQYFKHAVSPQPHSEPSPQAQSPQRPFQQAAFKNLLAAATQSQDINKIEQLLPQAEQAGVLTSDIQVAKNMLAFLKSKKPDGFEGDNGLKSNGSEFLKEMLLACETVIRQVGKELRDEVRRIDIKEEFRQFREDIQDWKASQERAIESSVTQRESALDDREYRMKLREADLRERESRLISLQTKFFDKADGDEFQCSQDSVASESSIAPERLLAQYRKNGGQLPMALRVAEVSALQEVATNFQDLGSAAHAQIQQLRERQRAYMPDLLRDWTEAAIERKTNEKDNALATVRKLTDSVTLSRCSGIQELSSIVYTTAQRMETVFAEAVSIEDGGEKILADIRALCAQVTTEDKLKQPLPSTFDATSLHTLLRLLEQSAHVAPLLQRLVDKAITGKRGCEVSPPPSVTKGIPRVLNKVHSKYDGDFTRVLDYLRSTIVCANLQSFKAVLQWLCNDSAPFFTICRAKDRISQDWRDDQGLAERSRYVLLNGWLDAGRGRRLIVEIQIHLRSLFLLKTEMRLLQHNARVLSMNDPNICNFAGVLTVGVLEKVEQGVICNISCCCTPISADHVDRLANVVKRDPCMIKAIELPYAILECEESSATKEVKPALDKWTLDRFFVRQQEGTIACSQIQIIRLDSCGLVGTIPAALKRCILLEELHLSTNYLEGDIPEWLADMPALTGIDLCRNLLSGKLDSLGRFDLAKVPLQTLLLHDNCFAGEITLSCAAVLGQVRFLMLGTLVGSNVDAWKVDQHVQHLSRVRNHAGFGNRHLWMTPDTICALRKAWSEDEMRLRKLGLRKVFDLDHPGVMPSSCCMVDATF